MLSKFSTNTVLHSPMSLHGVCMITEPKKISTLYDNLPESAKQSIEQRDK